MPDVSFSPTSWPPTAKCDEMISEVTQKVLIYHIYPPLDIEPSRTRPGAGDRTECQRSRDRRCY